jgi:hypothetical protein
MSVRLKKVPSTASFVCRTKDESPPHEGLGSNEGLGSIQGGVLVQWFLVSYTGC